MRLLTALKRKKRPDAAGNAKPKVKFVTHGGRSLLKDDPIDGRTVVAREYRRQLAALHAHVGTAATHPHLELIEQAARFAVLARVSWAEVMREGITNGSELTPSFVALVRVSKEQREALQLLGLERKEKPTGSIDEYLTGAPGHGLKEGALVP